VVVKVEAAGVFQRPGWLSPGHESEGSFRGLEAPEETDPRTPRSPARELPARGHQGQGARLQVRGEGQNFRVREEIAVFNRDEVRIRSIGEGDVLQLSVMERGRTRQIALDGEVVKESPGAAEVLAALSE
jgi:hypothetical protein